jgi:ankyrin repeat protein
MHGKNFKFAVMLLVMMLVMTGWLSAGEWTLHKAAAKGNVEVLKKILAKKPGLVNKLNEKGASALHFAAKKKQVKAVKLLLMNGADVNLKGKKDLCTPLHYAILGGDMDIVKMIVAKGADVNSREKDDETPVYYGAYMGRIDIIKFLMSKGAKLKGEKSKIHTNPLTYAVEKGHLETAKWLAANGVDPKIQAENKFNLLHRAAWEGKPEMIAWLLEQGIPVDSKTDFGRTPLHNAAMTGNTKGVIVLLKKGADVNAHGKEDWTALHLAAKRGHAETAAVLLKAGADVDFKQKKGGKTMLHMAATLGYGKIAKMLMSKGADPNAKDDGGKTPLYYAARYGHKMAAKVLVAGGAKTDNIKKHFGKSKLLAKKLKDGDALVWYLGHSGWAVKTQNHFLVFDYFKGENRPDSPCLANGSINPEEINGVKTVVFASHMHGDHYMPEVFGWKEKSPNIKYVMGFKPKEKDGYLYIPPRETKKLGGMEITTINSNDSGVGFFVKVDGVAIFHPGDHANRKRDFSGPYAAEIDFLAKNNMKPDLLFTPISGCGFGDLAAVKKGAYYAVKKLAPAVWFPMHAGGGEDRYQEFAKEAHEKGLKTPMYCAENSGDRFFFRQGADKYAGVYTPTSLKGVNGNGEVKKKMKKKKKAAGSCKAKTQ